MNGSRVVLIVLLGVLPALAGLPFATPSAHGEDFRIDNTWQVANQKEPPSQSTTIFHNGVVYDCMTAPAETVVFDQSAERFILLNLKLRTRAELTTTELAAFTDRLQQLHARSSDPVVKFLAAPSFQKHFDEATGELTLDSTWITYRLVLAPEANQAAVKQYHEFSDWYARLNALLVPGSCPPFARLVVNAALAQQKALPSQVARTLSPGKPNRPPSTIHSTHRVTRPLAPADLDRVAKTREFMVKFKLVSFDQYSKAEVR
jgi:hypothetical protein